MRAGRAAQTTPSVSVVVCAYTLDRWEDLAAAVDSLRGQTLPPGEVIIVSDHNPHLYRRVRETWPDLIALENVEGRGLSGARNTGVSAARGDIIAFLDDDALAAPDWIERLLAAYRETGAYGVGGAILPAWAVGRPKWFPAEFDWVVGCTYRGMPQERARVRNLIGANMSFRRELLEAAGSFQTGMGRIGTRPLGCEETELCIRGSQRVRDAFYIYDPAAVVRHTVPATRGSWRYFVSRCYSEGLSKAHVAELVGAEAGLASERSYTLRTLPAGVLRGILDALRGDIHGLRRAFAIVAGLGITALGYGRGLLARRAARRSRLKRIPAARTT
jgi:glycosyltransferase involved in cell wall biosynthesis